LTNCSKTLHSEFRLPIIKVLGLGGAGCNTINHIMEMNLSGIDCIAANTDMQVLQKSLAPIKIQLGPALTRGLGSGGDPQVGEKSAEESYRELNGVLEGGDMVFLTAGMGGGTGTGAIPIAARLAHSLNAVVISVVSTPFAFESGRRQTNACEGIAKLQPYSDTLIIVPNDRLLQVAPLNTSLDMAFRLSDDVLRTSIQSISELTTQTGLINVDFAHILRIMRMGGGSYIAIGHGQGKHKAQQAIQEALNHPLLENINLEQAKGVIVNFTGGASLSINEVVETLDSLRKQCHPDAEVIPGLINNPLMQDRAQVIIIVTGIGAFTLTNPVQAAAEFESESQKNAEDIIEETRESYNFVQTIKDPMEELEIPAFLRKQNQMINQK
jgi:cell division protein FtsZ